MSTIKIVYNRHWIVCDCTCIFLSIKRNRLWLKIAMIFNKLLLYQTSRNVKCQNIASKENLIWERWSGEWILYYGLYLQSTTTSCHTTSRNIETTRHEFAITLKSGWCVGNIGTPLAWFWDWNLIVSRLSFSEGCPDVTDDPTRVHCPSVLVCCPLVIQ